MKFTLPFDPQGVGGDKVGLVRIHEDPHSGVSVDFGVLGIKSKESRGQGESKQEIAHHFRAYKVTFFLLILILLPLKITLL